MKKLLVILYSLVMLMGCGGGDSGGGGSNPQADVSVSGKVIHSVYSLADIVCYDRNGNKECDAGEPSAQVVSGEYTLTGTEADAVAVPVVAELVNSGSGTSSLAAVPNIRLVFEAPAGQRTISSLSTIVKAKMDSDPSLSFDDAHSAVQVDLSTSEDLFNASPAVSVLAAEITAVIEAMFDDLSTRLGITISDKVIMLVVNEIMHELANIAAGKTPDQVVSDTIGGMADPQDILDQADDLAESMPKVMSMDEVMSQNMKMYQFHEGGSSSDYEFTLFVFSNTSLKFGTNTSYYKPLPTELVSIDIDWKASKNSDGSVTFSNDTSATNMVNVEVIPLGGKFLTPNPAHPQTTINFSTGAVMYKLNHYYMPALPSIEEIRRRLTNGGSTSYSTASAKISGNTIETKRNDDEEFHIKLNSDGTFKTTPQNAAATYDWHDAFGPKNNPPQGTYEKTKDSNGDDLYIFYVDGRRTFVVLNAPDRSYPNSFGTYYFVAGRYSSAGLESKAVFNKTAAEDIKSQW